MKILVTGGAGFIGSHVADTLLNAGHTIVIVDDLSSGNRKNLSTKADFHTMDVRDPNIATLFEKNRFDAVVHLAAQIDVRKSVQDPFVDASVNILGTLRLLECCRTYGVRKFVFSSSGGVMYGECPKKPASESLPAQPIAPYGFSKLAAERYVRFYGDFYKLDYTTLRYGNVYGPRQDPHGEAGVVAIFSGKAIRQEPVTVFGTGEQSRDYVYVQDVADANLAALVKGSGETLNIGTGVATSVNDLYAVIAKLSGSKAKAKYAPARPGELNRNVLDASRAKEKLGWKPRLSLEKGLAETLRYFTNEKSR
jgi:UDP-glucose 4-epimerase